MKKSRKKVIITCLECGMIINGGSHMSSHVKKEHNYYSYDDYKIKFNLIKSKSQLKCEGAIDCKICGILSHDLTSHITRVHNIKPSIYKEKYGNFRSEKYLKNQSENIKGEKNPAFKHNGKFSPLSENFIYYDENYKIEIIEKISKSNKNNGNTNTTLKYWLSKGYSEEDAKNKLSERQQTFTLQKCVKKYGEELGKEIWLKRQERWIDSCKKSRKNGFSIISQELFWKIYSHIQDKNSIYFAELNENKEEDKSGYNNEYKLKLEDRFILPDFIDIEKKKIIEFDGTYWHGKHIVNNTNKLRDNERDKLALNSGFLVMRVKESEYRKFPNKVLQECLEFLNV